MLFLVGHQIQHQLQNGSSLSPYSSLKWLIRMRYIGLRVYTAHARFEFVQPAFLRLDHLSHAFRHHLLRPSVKCEVKGRYRGTASENHRHFGRRRCSHSLQGRETTRAEPVISEARLAVVRNTCRRSAIVLPLASLSSRSLRLADAAFRLPDDDSSGAHLGNLRSASNQCTSSDLINYSVDNP